MPAVVVPVIVDSINGAVIMIVPVVIIAIANAIVEPGPRRSGCPTNQALQIVNPIVQLSQVVPNVSQRTRAIDDVRNVVGQFISGVGIRPQATVVPIV
jgi:hypothetical protein